MMDSIISAALSGAQTLGSLGRGSEKTPGSAMRSAGFQYAPPHENNPESQRAAHVQAMQKKSLGKDVLGEEKFVDERGANHAYNQMFDKDGKVKSFAGIKGREVTSALEADVKKTHGKLTLRNGAQTGVGFGWQGNRVASGWAHLGSSVVDSTKLIGEGGMNALGLMTRQQQLQFKTGGAVAKAMAIAPAAFSLYNNVSTILDGGDMGEALAMNMMAVGGAVGMHAGKSLAAAGMSGLAATGAGVKSAFRTNTIGPKGPRTGGAAVVTTGADGKSKLTGGKLRIASQVVGGAAGGLVGTVVAGGIGYGARDLTSSESSIAKAARNYTSLTSSASIEQNNATLTMRQRSLQQLSQSALNDRGSLLGNEAAILKNLQ